MDHDSVPVDVAPPASHRVADIKEAYRRITHRGLEAMRERITGEPMYDSNESGHFAWDISLLIRAACLTWRLTGDLTHLRQASEWAQHLVERTDRARGAKDWRGRSGPVWSAGSRYTASTARVGTAGGRPIHIQAAADSIVIEKPSSTTAIVKAFSNTGNTWKSPLASLRPDDGRFLPDVLSGQSASFMVQLRGIPHAVDLSFLEPGRHELKHQFAPHLIHTGMIARSLIAAATALHNAGTDGHESEVAPNDLLTAARESLLFHDNEIRVKRGQPWYVTPADFPGRRLKLELPHNHIVDVATSFLILGKRHTDYELHNLGSLLARRFLAEIEAYSAGTFPHPWFYYPADSDTFSGIERSEPLAERSVLPVPRAEDSSHATMRARALTDWKAFAPDLVPDEALSRVAFSFRRDFLSSENGTTTLRWLPGDKKIAVRRGVTDTFPGAWGTLAPWEATIKRRVNALAYNKPPQRYFGATVLSAAEILSLNV